MIVLCCLAAGLCLHAQAPAEGSSQDAAAQGGQKPAANPQQQGGAKPESNPFPEDTSTVPVMPSTSSAAAAAPDTSGTDSSALLPGEDSDPVRSPDDPTGGEASGAQESSSSSSLQGIDQLIPAPGSDVPEKKKAPTHQEGAAEDISVGTFYMERKDWKGALSRFESALVLDPENPDVYWGLAESERHLGNFAAAKANYQKVMEYDPGSRHAKDAGKALKQPELANAPAVSSNPAAVQSQP